MEKKRIEILERESLAFNILHEMLRSGKWAMDFDEQGKMTRVYWSDEFRQMIGYNNAEDFPNVLESWSDLLHPDDKDRVLKEYQDTIADYTGAKTYDVEYRLKTKNQGWRWYRATGKLTRREDGTPITYIGMFVDITAQKQKDFELQEQHRLLSDALRQAQHANKAKTTFLNNMSHDIRTPMNAIMGFATLALNHMDNKDLVRDYLSKILTSSKHLLSLINDVLDMSRIESGKVRIEEHECNLSDIMRDLKAIVQSDIKAKRIKFNIDTLDVVHEDIFCDKLRLNQVLLNLLSNSFKFTAPGGTINVRITEKTEAPEGYAAYTFHVKDTGIGMSKEFQKHVFEPFERERTSTVSGIQGTGLGMAIAKNIVNMMNGNISVESEEGVGTEFTIDFTFRLSSHQRIIGKIQEIEGCRVLIADDDFNTCASLSKMLASIGLRSEWTASGEEAILRTKLALEQDDPFFAYIIDWLMPDLNGIEAVRRIRKVIGHEHPMIIMTAYDWADVEEDAKEAGVTAFCSKPLFLSDLQHILLKYSKNITSVKLPETEQKTGFFVEEFEGKRVLLVEDMEMNQILASTILNEMGCVVEIADNGQIAVEKVQSADYDVVLMDIQMPIMNGYEAAQAIRSLPEEKFKKIPIIAMTANAFDEDRQRAIEAGMNGHLGKPIEIDKLRETLLKYFSI